MRHSSRLSRSSSPSACTSHAVLRRQVARTTSVETEPVGDERCPVRRRGPLIVALRAWVVLVVGALATFGVLVAVYWAFPNSLERERVPCGRVLEYVSLRCCAAIMSSGQSSTGTGASGTCRDAPLTEGPRRRTWKCVAPVARLSEAVETPTEQQMISKPASGLTRGRARTGPVPPDPDGAGRRRCSTSEASMTAAPSGPSASCIARHNCSRRGDDGRRPRRGCNTTRTPRTGARRRPLPTRTVCVPQSRCRVRHPLAVLDAVRSPSGLGDGEHLSPLRPAAVGALGRLHRRTAVRLDADDWERLRRVETARRRDSALAPALGSVVARSDPRRLGRRRRPVLLRLRTRR